ncbi:MAG TPA: CBS domain-containing protein [Thermoleophilia bacterium]|nr:CBS domain-containing protein [Thermoleophilia bacterium]
MSQSSADIKVADIITTHQNVDFDAFAAAVGASRLFPEARIVFAGSLNRNVREFVALHGEDLPIVGFRSLDLASVRRLIVVDTSDCARLAELGSLCGRPDVEVVVFDHHEEEAPERPSFVEGENWVLSTDGAQATSMVHILRERDVPISPLEATIFALGIHEDTGSLTYPRSTVRDAEMLALCLRLGASQALIEHYLHNPLTAEQRAILLRMVDEVRVVEVWGQEIHVVAMSHGEYVDGLSVIAHKLMDLLNSDVLLQVVEMEGRVFVTARSRSAVVDVAGLLASVGGGGHAQAASAVLRDRSAENVLDGLLGRLAETVPTLPTAGDIMSHPVRFIDAETPVDEALLTAQRYGHSGISVKEAGFVVGIVARRDLDKAVRHGLGHAPVKGVMTRNVVFAPESATVDEVRRLMGSTNVGRLPILTDAAYERARELGRVEVEGVVGIATRTDVLAALQVGSVPDRELGAPAVCAIRSLTDLPAFGKLFRAVSALSEDFPGVYLVGGFVRDLLLEKPNADIDIAVDGDGIDFARRLAAKMGGRVRTHQKFQTAVVLVSVDVVGDGEASPLVSSEPFHVDVATTRTEFYDYPAALPSVEHASIRQDLFRRDFSINAMAVSLKGQEFGEVLDFFGGLKDLQEGVIRVLHNLSFIEDPTRIFRAVRYENRYGFRMDEQTRSLARSCVEMRLVGDLSSARLRDELVALLGEKDVDWTLARLFELGVARQVHPKLATGERTVRLIQVLDGLVEEFGVASDVVSWRLRLAAITRNMSHEELFIWLEKLRLRHADRQVVRDSVILGPHLVEQLADEARGDWDVFRLLRKVPIESLVFALGRTPSGPGQDRLRQYLEVLRKRSLDVTGADIMALGQPSGSGVGRVLAQLTRLRIEGDLESREEQLAAAAALVRRTL